MDLFGESGDEDQILKETLRMIRSPKYGRRQPTKRMWTRPSNRRRKCGRGGGLVACACWNNHTTLGWKHSGFLLVLMAILTGFTIFLPYIGAMARNAMPAFLPFISQAGGKPPMTGMLSVSMIVLGFVAILPFFLLYINIAHRNVNGLKKVRIANNLALPISLMASMGCIITASFPVGYTQVPNKFEWLTTVLLEHGFGACMILIGLCIVQFFYTFIWFALADISKLLKYARLGLCVVYAVMFLACVKPMPDHLYEELGPEPFNMELLKSTPYDLPLVFTTSYKISAICEWAVCVFSAFYFLTLYKEFQRVSFHVVLRHKSCFNDSAVPTPTITCKR